jgi:hypothetical protein
MTLPTVGDEIQCVLQTCVDKQRKIWLCARDKYNSGSPVYVQGVPNNHKAGDVIVAVIADARGTLFYVQHETGASP